MHLMFRCLMSACMLVLTNAHCLAAELPRIGGVVNYVAAKGSVLVNGMPVVHFSVDKDGSGGSGMKLTEWLVNGANDITLTVTPTGERASAELQLQNFDSGEMLLTLKQEGEGERHGSISASGLPSWAWEKAGPQGDAADGLADAVGALHAAYEGSDIDAVVKISAPFFADQRAMGGLTADIFRQRMAPMLKSGTLHALPKLTITRHLGGKLFRVFSEGGQPPIMIVIEMDGMKNTLRMGEWWSMIDGAWKVVR